MKKDYLLALAQLEEEKGISKEALFDTLEKALIKSYEKNFDNKANVEVEIDEETGNIKVYSMRKVVEEVEDSVQEISLDAAKKINPLYELEDLVPVEVTPKNFGRIAAQTARNIVIQKIKDYEREAIYDDFIDREKELITGTIQRIENENLFIDLGKTEGIVPVGKQVPGEIYHVNDRLKFFIKEVKNTNKGAQIILSRSSKDLIVRLFELEVPEIAEGVVEIYSIAREAGSRTKIAVFANEEEIDPVGACVGYKGTRVKTIVDELNGEKIDIIIYSKDSKEFIANALSPSDVSEVFTDDELKSAIVVVPDEQLSLSIGKEGQNVRLAAKLTSWKIDIIGSSQYQEMLDNDTFEDFLEKSFAEEEEKLKTKSQDEEDLDDKDSNQDSQLIDEEVSEDSKSDHPAEANEESNLNNDDIDMTVPDSPMDEESEVDLSRDSEDEETDINLPEASEDEEIVKTSSLDDGQGLDDDENNDLSAEDDDISIENEEI